MTDDTNPFELHLDGVYATNSANSRTAPFIAAYLPRLAQ